MSTTSNACRLLPVESATAAPVPPQGRRPTALLVLYGLTGFGGVLAEQGFERYVSLLVGATASGSAVVLFTYFLGFALGGVGAARLVRKGRIARPLLAYGLAWISTEHIPPKTRASVELRLQDGLQAGMAFGRRSGP